MKMLTWIFMVMLTLPLTLWAAERVELRSVSDDVSVTVLESSADRIVLRCEVNAFSRDTRVIEGQSYTTLRIPHESILLNAGEPELPRLCRSIMIPGDAAMEVRVLDSEYSDYPDTRIVPSKGSLPRTINPDDVPYSFGSVYQVDAWYPAELTELRDPYILRDVRGTVVDVHSFRYHPIQHVLRVYTSVTVEVRATGRSSINTLTQTLPDRVDPEFDRIYRRHFVNYAAAQSVLDYVPVIDQGDMLVITYDGFHDAMLPFVEWKIQKGIPTTLVNVTTIGNTSTAIQNYIQNLYTTSGGDLAFVLLVGDATQIATPTASGGSSDPSYAKVAGADDYPDIFVGRFSAESIGNVQTQVERSVEYERDAQAGAAWYHLATGIASAEGDGIGHNDGEIDYEHMGFIRTDLLGYNYTAVDQIYDPGASASQVSTALNTGRGLINYTGHGSTQAWSTTGFSNSNVTALTNTNRLPFIFSVACVNGQFSGYTCFAEAWLRATSGGEPTGALATYMSSINQDWVPPMDAQDEFTDLVVAEARHSFGGLCYNASCKMMDLNGSSGVNMYNTWHIFGDPSVQVYTNTPGAMSVSHAGEIFFGQPDFSVTVSGVEGALCAISQGTTLFGAAFTNVSGAAVIPIEGDLPIGESVKLTVTAFNKLTYVADVPVIASGPDIWPPNISLTPIADTNDETGPYALTAAIHDYSGVASATFHYGFNGTSFSPLPMTYEGGDDWSVEFGGYPAGTIVYYYLTAIDSSDSANTAVSDTFDFAVLGLLLSDDIEMGQGDWTTAVITTGWTNQWHISSEMSHSASHAWKFGDTGTGTYASHAYGELVSPPVHLRGQASLSFWHWIQGEISSYYPDSAYDAGVVDISVDGGAWQQLTTLTPAYNKISRCTAGGSSPYTGPFTCRTPCYSGDVAWTQVSVSLDEYAGHDIRIRFRFGSDNSGAREGWYVDDVTIFGLPEIPVVNPVTDLAMDVLETGELRLTWSAVPGATEYRVYSSTEPGGPFTTLETTIATNEAFLTPADGDHYFIVIATAN